MSLNFGQKIEEKSNDVIPKDTILWAAINVREVKNSRETNGRYLDIELTVYDNQPYARRKIWDKLPDPFDPNNSKEWRDMGYGAVRRILEAVKGASPDNPNSYVLNQLTDIHGLIVPVLIGIEKGKDGYEDKNRVEYLSPHSSVKKVCEAYRLLTQGVFQYGKPDKPTAPQQGSMFAGTASPAPVSAPQMASAPAPAAGAPGWLAPAAAAPAAQPAAFQPAPAAAVPQPQYQAPPAAAAPPQGFPQGTAPAQPQQGQFQAPPANTAHVNPAAPQPQPSMNTGQPAPAASASPSNAGWQPPGATGTPAQFPNGQ